MTKKRKERELNFEKALDVVVSFNASAVAVFINDVAVVGVVIYYNEITLLLLLLWLLMLIRVAWVISQQQA